MEPFKGRHGYAKGLIGLFAKGFLICVLTLGGPRVHCARTDIPAGHDPHTMNYSHGTDSSDHKGPVPLNQAYDDIPVNDMDPDGAAKLRDLLMDRFEPKVEREMLKLESSVRVLTQDQAHAWIGGFISEHPFFCPEETRKDWIKAITGSVQRNRLPLCKQILGLTVALISIESGFRADPFVGGQRGGEGMQEMLKRAEAELMEKIAPFFAIPPIPRLYEQYRQRYYGRLLECKTEGEVERLAREIAQDLRHDAKVLPGFLRSKVGMAIDGLENVVRTKGSMQLGLARAKKAMARRGDNFSDKKLTRYMYTIDGGVDVGVAALRPLFVQYFSRFASPEDHSWLFFVGMDYHYGAFSCRNMMEQIRLRDLSGMSIPIDGDFLHYDRKGRPTPAMSLTREAASLAFQSMDHKAIFKSFLLEKAPHYIYTDLHEMIVRTHEKMFGETPFAMIGNLWMGKEALIKHGAVWKTDLYLKKLDQRLNMIPWAD